LGKELSMRETRDKRGLRLPLAVAALTLLGLSAGAAVPSSAGADDDDDNGDNGSGFVHRCDGGTKLSNTPTNQNCLITASTGTCIQRSDADVVVQTCTFTQSSSTSNLRATALQIHNPEGGPDGTQDGTQVIDVTQANTSPSRSNFLSATQIADQCLGAGDNFEDDDGDWNDEDDDGDRDDDGECEDGDEEDGDDEEESEDNNGLPPLNVITQDQEAHQSIDGTQSNTGAGKNESNASQTQNLHERAANALEINQFQNTDDRDDACNAALVSGFTNACYTIDQDANTGANISRLSQVYKLFQSARDTLTGEQRQGSFNPFEGGLNHGFDQDNTGIAPAGTPIQLSPQVERLTQRRDNTGTMAWHQHGPLRKDVGNQFGSQTARANISQDSVLSSTGGDLSAGEQTDVLQIECSSSGNCTGFQHAKTNDDEETNGPLTAAIISMTIVCGDPEVPDDDIITILQEDGECVANSGVD
jgi:hypothetical protein